MKTLLAGTDKGGGDQKLTYEPPVITPMGSLHDLLAGGGSQGCDSCSPEAGPDPFPACNQPPCV
jgi:hypothetical protein